jgi:transcriptional adapter 3
MDPTEVKEDFSKAKPPTQVSITTFYSSVEPWLRPLREDELGLLEWDVGLILYTARFYLTI